LYPLALGKQAAQGRIRTVSSNMAEIAVTTLWVSLLILVVLAGWLLNLFSLPGNWLNVVAAACYAGFASVGVRLSIGWWVVGVVLVLAILGEVAELAAGAAGAAKVGGSRRSVVLAAFGSFVGAMLGAWIGLPIPVVGSLVGVVLFACVGALAGAVLGEWWKGRNWEARWQVGQAAFWGRLFGTVGKVTLGSIIVVVILAALVLK
jgi:uncharacterized protein YqgC (DUF456 family)